LWSLTKALTLDGKNPKNERGLKVDKVLELLKGAVRPVLAYLFGGALVAMAVIAFVKFGTPELGRELVIGIVGIGGTIVGFYFQSRSQSK
jgi:drug/metabolite transporter (DMT)-like permease